MKSAVEPTLDGPGDQWTPERLRLRAWFDQRAPCLSSIYVAAVGLSGDHSLGPAWPYLLAHAVREIRNRLPGEIAQEAKGRVDYQGLTRAVHEEWKRSGLPAEGAWIDPGGSEPDEAGPATCVDNQLLVAISRLLKEHVAGTARRQGKFERLAETLGADLSSPKAFHAWKSAADWSESYMHVRSCVLNEEDRNRVLDGFSTFETALIAITGRSYENMDQLDDILDNANS